MIFTMANSDLKMPCSLEWISWTLSKIYADGLDSHLTSRILSQTGMSFNLFERAMLLEVPYVL